MTKFKKITKALSKAVGFVTGTSAQKKAARKVRDQQNRQARAARLAASNTAALEKVRSKTGAKVKIGTKDRADAAKKKAQSNSKTRTGTSIGGIASGKLGL